MIATDVSNLEVSGQQKLPQNYNKHKKRQQCALFLALAYIQWIMWQVQPFYDTHWHGPCTQRDVAT